MHPVTRELFDQAIDGLRSVCIKAACSDADETPLATFQLALTMTIGLVLVWAVPGVTIALHSQTPLGVLNPGACASVASARSACRGTNRVDPFDPMTH